MVKTKWRNVVLGFFFISHYSTVLLNGSELLILSQSGCSDCGSNWWTISSPYLHPWAVPLYFFSSHTKAGEKENGLVCSSQPVRFGPAEIFMSRSNCIWQTVYGSQNSWCENTLQTVPFLYIFFIFLKNFLVLILWIHSVVLNV